MPARTLFKESLEAYLVEAKRELGRPWCFLHIPKTAGTSLKETMRAQFSYRNIYLSPDEYLNVQSGHDSYSGLLKAKLAKFIPQLREGSITAISGHLQYESVESLKQALPEIRLMTFLRNPVDRVISDYRYCLSPEFPGHQEFRRQYPTIKHYLSNTGEMNKMHSYLKRGAQETATQTAERVANEFSLVGLVERYDEFVHLFCRINEVKAPPLLRLNTTKNEELTKNDLVDERELIADANQSDVDIYRYFSPLLECRLQ